MAVEILTVMPAIGPGQEQPVRAALDKFTASGDSPFADVPGTHVARLVVMNSLGTGDTTSRRRLRPTRLLFSAVIDGPAHAWLWGLFEKQGPTFEEVFRHCAGWPDGPGSTARASWLLERRIPITYGVVGNDASVAEIRRGLARRDALREVASEPAGRTPAELRAAYRAAMELSQDLKPDGI